MDSIHQGIRRFQQDVQPSEQGHFDGLASGQQPQLMLVTCSDSRIDPALFTQTRPGEVFVIRNAGNLVAPHGSGASGEAATLEYGIEALKIPHLAVCGHTHCGAMAAVRDPESAAALPAVTDWIAFGMPAIDRQDEIRGFDDPLSKVVAANVLVQLDHLRTHPSVKAAEERGDLQLHGWVYDFVNGVVYATSGDGVFSPL